MAPERMSASTDMGVSDSAEGEGKAAMFMTDQG